MLRSLDVDRLHASSTGIRLAASLVLVLALACTGPAPSSPPADAGGDVEIGFLQYAELLGPKAFAIAFDGQEVAYGFAHTGFDRDAARERALARCSAQREHLGVRPPCALYAVDDEIVWSLRDEIEGFAHYPGHKALWVSGDAEAHLFDSAFGLASREEAARIAMQDCRTNSTRFGFGVTCRICQLDDGVPCTELEDGWEGIVDDGP